MEVFKIGLIWFGLFFLSFFFLLNFMVYLMQKPFLQKNRSGTIYPIAWSISSEVNTKAQLK